MFSMLAAFIAVMFAMIGGGATARAQCCTFRVDVNCNLAATCLPITVKTNWTGGGVNNSQGNTVVGCGVSTFPITVVPCPPQPVLNIYSLNGGAGIPFGAPPTQVFLIPGACCVWTWATFDLAGCPIIYIVPC
jgi:hypothetical protein